MARSLSMVSDGVHQSVSLSAIDENGELQTGLKGSVTATGEDGESREFTMQERAPGDYIAELSEDLVGSMGLKAALFQDEEGSSELPKNKRGEALLRGRGRIEQAFPLEYAPEMALDPALDPARPTLAAAKPRLAVDGYQALLFIALSALLLELLARRLGEVTHGLG